MAKASDSGLLRLLKEWHKTIVIYAVNGYDINGHKWLFRCALK
jgi:hypothetical protein